MSITTRSSRRIAAATQEKVSMSNIDTLAEASGTKRPIVTGGAVEDVNSKRSKPHHQEGTGAKKNQVS